MTTTITPVRATVTWSVNGAGNYVREDTINLANSRERGMEDHEAARRILAIARLEGLDDADSITIHVLNVH